MKPWLSAALVAATMASWCAGEAWGAARTWSSSIYYFNPSGAAGWARIDYLSGGGVLLSSAAVPIAGWGSGLLPQDILPSGFSGSAVIASDLPLVAAYRQEGAGATVTAPMFTTAAAKGLSGLGGLLVPGISRTRRLTSLVIIQNLEPVDVDLALDFFPASGGAPVSYLPGTPLSPGYSLRVNPRLIAQLGTVFNGSVRIVASRTTDAAPARVAAAVQSLPNSGALVYDSEAIPGGEEMLLPQVECGTASSGRRTVLEVQNGGDAEAVLSVRFFYPVVGAGGETGVVETSAGAGPVAPGGRASMDACSVPGIPDRPNVTAIVSAADSLGDPVPLAASAKTVTAGSGATDSLAGSPRPPLASDGKYRVVLPFVRWDRPLRGYRTTVGVMNAAPAAAEASVPASVTLTWYRQDGVSFIQNLSVHTKASASPRTGGALTSANSFMGAVVLESETPITAVASVRNQKTGHSGSYRAVPLP